MIIEDTNFKTQNYSEKLLPKDEYELCVFDNCTFSNSDISNITFRECEFISCDLSLTNIKHTIFNDVKFINCKLLGLHFNDCDDLFMSINFDGCNLELSVFYKLDLKKTSFKDCKLNSVDFTETNLSNAIFEHCDLKNAIFHQTILKQVDFRTSFNFSIDPEYNNIKKAKFSKNNLAGLLVKHQLKIDD